MKPGCPIALQLQRDCHDTLPWLISFSLGDVRINDSIAAANANDDHRYMGITIRHDNAPNDAAIQTAVV
jgi:hypothetical protein